MASELEIRLLGGVAVLFRGQRVLHTREHRLLICMVLAPEQRSRWAALGADPSRAKTVLRARLGDAWVDPTPGVYRFAQSPHVDLEAVPAADAEAFDYCCARGDLLPGDDYAAVDWIEDARNRYHERLGRITARLVEQAQTPAEVEALLKRAERVLLPSEVEVLRSAPPSGASTITADADLAPELLSRLEGEMANPDARPAHIIPHLERLVDAIEGRAIARQPYRSEVLDHASLLVTYFQNILDFDAERLVWRLANSRMYASDISGAFAELRPWVESPVASPGGLCIAGLLNVRLGWLDAAHETYSAALARNRSPEFAVILREKRDIQIPQGQGENRSEQARLLRDDPYFDALSTGARASVYCNEARGASSATAALRLYQRAQQIDKTAENPHYELNIARAAIRVGKPELASEHLHTFGEMLQTQTEISLWYSQMTVHAEQIEAGQLDPQAKSSPQARARLQQAAALHAAVVAGRLRSGDLSSACSSFLKRARIALALRRSLDAFEFAHTVAELAPRRCERFLPTARTLELQARTEQLSESAATDRMKFAKAQVQSIERNLPAPLLPHHTAS